MSAKATKSLATCVLTPPLAPFRSGGAQPLQLPWPPFRRRRYQIRIFALSLWQLHRSGRMLHQQPGARRDGSKDSHSDDDEDTPGFVPIVELLVKLSCPFSKSSNTRSLAAARARSLSPSASRFNASNLSFCLFISFF